MIELCSGYLSLRYIRLYVFIMSHTRFRLNPHSIVELPECQGTPRSKQAWNLKFKWLQLDSNPEPFSSSTNTQLFCQTDKLIQLSSDYIFTQHHLIVCFYHVTHTFQSESTLYSCLNVKELLSSNRCKISCLNDCNCTRTKNHLVPK